MKTERTALDLMASLCANSATLIMTGAFADMLARGLQPYQKKCRLLGPGGNYRALHTQAARLERLAKEMTIAAKALVKQCCSNNPEARCDKFNLVGTIMGRAVNIEEEFMRLSAEAESFSRTAKKVAQILRNRIKYRRVGVDGLITVPQALDAVRPSRRNVEDLVEAFAALQDTCIRLVGPVKYVTQRCYDCVADKECGVPREIALQIFKRYLHADIDLGSDAA